MTEAYGPRTNPVTNQPQLHNGDDFRAHLGDNIRSTQDGAVASVDSAGAGPGGHQITVSNSDGSMSGYAHTAAADDIKKGTTVYAGQAIGTSDGSGRATGPHLHYTYRPGSANSPATRSTKPADPMKTQFKDKKPP